jgi:hypothetical protein
VSMDPFGLKFITPKTNLGLFLERCEDQGNPEYIVYAKTKCYECGKWCWLGDQTFAAVDAGEAVPFCVPCGSLIFPQGSPFAVDVLRDRR